MCWVSFSSSWINRSFSSSSCASITCAGVLQFARYGDWCSVGNGSSSGCGWGGPPEGTMSSSFHYIMELEMFAEIANATGHSADAQVPSV